MNKEQRQELLEKLLKKEMEWMKKRAFYYKHRTLLNNPVIIVEEDLSKYNKGIYHTVGLHEIVDKKNDFRYTHKITIESKLIDNYINATKGWKSYYKRKISKIIRHELCHCFTKDHYDGWGDISYIEYDSSPIFASIIHWFKAESNYFLSEFMSSKLYQEIKDFKEYDELEKYLFKLMLNYDKAVRKIDEKYKPTIKTLENIQANIFIYGSKNLGLKALKTSKDSVVYLEGNKRSLMACNVFSIGFHVMPQDLERLVERKINNGCFDKVEEKYLIVKGEEVKTIRERVIERRGA